MQIIYCAPNQEPELRNVNNLNLDTMQGLVEGLIEPIYLSDEIVLFDNEEGKYCCEPNRRIKLAHGYDTIHGSFFISGMDEEGEAIGLTDAQAKEMMAFVQSLPQTTERVEPHFEVYYIN
jgi:Domain of unknown function (DUF3846)